VDRVLLPPTVHTSLQVLSRPCAIVHPSHKKGLTLSRVATSVVIELGLLHNAAGLTDDLGGPLLVEELAYLSTVVTSLQVDHIRIYRARWGRGSGTSLGLLLHITDTNHHQWLFFAQMSSSSLHR
jgi:hypothetical protein